MAGPAAAEIEASLATLLSRWDSEGRSSSLLDSLCSEHPSLAFELRSRAEALARADTLLYTPSPHAAETPTVPGYQISRLLGEGGMGSVWEALQLSTRRRVALKVLPPHRLASTKALARFEREVELAARLDHPLIARVFECGQVNSPQSTLYFSMELVEGLPADQHYSHSALGARLPDVLNTLLRAADALAYAHSRGVLHRDLKPSNLLVTPDGLPHLLDFGLARELDADPTLTLEAPFAGTPGYCAPEQARGEQATVRSDLFSLALIAVRLLMGEHTYDVLLPPQRLLHHVATTPPDLTPLKALPPDLRAVLAKALSFDPEGRYPTVDAFATDLKAYLAGFPVTARPPGVVGRLTKWVRRNRRAVLIGSAASLAVLTAGGLLTHRLLAERATADQNARIAAEANAFVTTILTSATPDAAQGREVTAREVLERAAATVDSQSLPPEVEAHVRHTIGAAIGAVGDPARGVPHLRKALAIRQTHLGSEHPDTLESMDILGRTLSGLPLGPDFDEGLELMRMAWDGKRKLASGGKSGPLPPGDASGRAIVSGTNYALALDFAQRRTQASAVIRTVLADVGDGPTRHDMWNLQVLQLRVLVEDRRFDAAATLANEILRAREARYGPTHTSVANALFNLGRVYELAERYPEAEAAYRRCLTIRTGFSPEHPSADDTRVRLATVLHHQGKTEEAKALVSQITNPQANKAADSLRTQSEATGR